MRRLKPHDSFEPSQSGDCVVLLSVQHFEHRIIVLFLLHQIHDNNFNRYCTISTNILKNLNFWIFAHSITFHFEREIYVIQYHTVVQPDFKSGISSLYTVSIHIFRVGWWPTMPSGHKIFLILIPGLNSSCHRNLFVFDHHVIVDDCWKEDFLACWYSISHRVCTITKNNLLYTM